VMKAELLTEAGDKRAGETEAAGGIDILRSEVERTGRADLQEVLESALKRFPEQSGFG